MTVIESWQFRGHMTGVDQKTIAKGCSLSVRAVQKAIKSIERKGQPVVARRDSKGDATHYWVRQHQVLMNSRSNSPEFISPNPSDARSKTPGTEPPASPERGRSPSTSTRVDKCVENHQNQELLTGVDHSPYEPRSPESPPRANHVRTLSVTSSESTNSKPRAELRPDSVHLVQNEKAAPTAAPIKKNGCHPEAVHSEGSAVSLVPFKGRLVTKESYREHVHDIEKEQSDREKVEAKLRRLARLAVAANSPAQPIRMSEAEFERHKQDQKRRLEEHIAKKAGAR